MAKIFKEPLLHFLVLGAALFGLYSMLNENTGEESSVENPDAPRTISKEIVITNPQIKNLAAQFKKTWNREPTDQERSGLIQEYIRNEVMYRQALTLNLDREDPAVKKRMRQKLEFLTNDITALAPPKESDLMTFLEKNSQKYRLSPSFTFTQVFFNKEKRGDKIEADMKEALSKLPKTFSPEDLHTFGDRTILSQDMVNATQQEVANRFGQRFANALVEIPLDSWSGPVVSGYGTHLVFVSERKEGELPTLENVRAEIERDWLSEMRTKSNEAIYESWRTQFTITIEGESTPGKGSAE